jgi:drug/metabolite transporter (DMT)-like permease
VPSNLPPLVAPATMLLASLIYVVPVALVVEFFVSPSVFTMPASLSVLGLAVFGTLCAYILYYRIIKHSGPVSLSMSLYVMAFFSVFLGWIVLSEQLSWTVLVAGVLIITGMVIVNRKRPTPIGNGVKN